MSLTFDVQAEPKTWTVDDDGPADFHTIQEAINTANNGDTIFVAAGTYCEQVIVNKSVSLTGEDKYNTIIDGNDTVTPLTVVSDNVKINEFTIQNSSKLDPAPNPGTDGLYMESDNCLVTNCVISDNARGIRIYRSMNNTFYGNIIRDNWETGFLVAGYCGSNNLDSNNVSENGVGIHLYRNHYSNNLSNNKLTNNHYNFKIEMESSALHPQLRDLIHHIDSSNTVDGKPMYYWVNEHDKQIPEDAGHVALINSTNIVVRNLNLSNNWQGVLLAYTTNSTVEEVNAFNNSIGISLYESYQNKLINNTVTDNSDGILLDQSDYNIVTGHTITNNSYSGILIDGWSSNNTFHKNDITDNYDGICITIGSDNKFYHNNFINNEYHAYIYNLSYFYPPHIYKSSNNTWDDGYPSGGNYWSDYTGADVKSGPYQNETGSDGIGDAPYIIDENNRDNYPLMEPWSPPRSILGDLNNDGTVNIGDIAIVAKAFGSYIGHRRWDSAADMNKDDVIDILDIALVARNFGETA